MRFASMYSRFLPLRTKKSKAMTITRADDEIIDLLARAPHVLEFKPSDEARARVWGLIAREKEGTLTEEEKSELDHYAQIEHLMRLVKARARKHRQQVV